MSVRKLNKLTGLEPQKETLEEFQGPSRSLKETIEIVKNIKLELQEVEHYIEKSEGPERGLKPQLEKQLIKTKQEMVRLARMLEETLEAEQQDFFEDEEADQKVKLGHPA